MQGVLLAGRFRIGDRLGAGGMGQVWAAQDERMRRDVAVKVVHPQYGMDEAETQARFQREVQLAGRLSHQNIVTMHDWGEVVVDGRRTLFLVMELVHGVPLHRRLAESTPAWPLAVGWGAQIAEALAAAHEEGVVHRDIKPANVLLTPSGMVKVLDFGVAKFMGETLGARELTVVGAPLGSPPYMSPEQADGDRAVDHRSDLYSLGCLLYHAVTGRQPFTGSSQWAVLRKQLEEAPVPPGAYVEGLPSSLNDLILGLLAKRPEERPAAGAVVCEALSTLLADHAVTDLGGGTLDVVQLGSSHSVAGKLLKRAWEVYQRAEWNRADQLKRAREDGSARRADAAEVAEAVVAAARKKANRLIAEATAEAELRRARADREIERLHERARQERVAAGEQLAKAQVKAEELVSEAKSEASRWRIAGVKKTERMFEEAEQRTSALREEAEQHRAEVGDAKYAVTKAERRLEVLGRAHELLSAQIERDAAEVDRRIEESLYQGFRQSIDRRFPTLDEFSADVKVLHGVRLPPGEALSMLNRFVKRFNAEPEEDHIA